MVVVNRITQERDEIPEVFALLPYGSLPLSDGPIPQAQLVKIAQDVDSAIRQEGEEKTVSH